MRYYTSILITISLFVVASSVQANTERLAYDPLGGLSSGYSGSPDDEGVVVDTGNDETGSISDIFADEEPDSEKRVEEETEEVEDPVIKDNTSAESGTDEIALTIAECIIMQQLEIEDERCEELFADVSCQDYTACVETCQATKRACYVNCDTLKDECKECRYYYKQCVNICGETTESCPAAQTVKEPDTTPTFRLISSQGDVRITYETDPRAVDLLNIDEDSTMEAGGAIYTGDNSSVYVYLPNGASQRIGPNSYFRIADYHEGSNVDETVVLFEDGSIEVNIPGDNDKPTAYVLITPMAKYQAKGTEFTVDTTAAGERLTVTEGTVEVLSVKDDVWASAGPGQTLTVTPTNEIVDYSSDVVFPGSQAEEKRDNLLIWGVLAALLLGVIILVCVGIIITIRVKRNKA